MGAANTKETKPTASSQITNNHPDIPNTELRENDLKWENAENYAAVIRLNRSFLNGETRSTMYHYAPIQAETLPLVKGLLRLYDFGILTITGQLQLRETPKFITVNGRSFYLQTFRDLLLQHPSVVTKIVDDLPGRTPRSTPAKVQSNTVENRYPHTLTRNGTTADELERADFDVYTGIPRWIEEAEWPSFGCKAIDQAWPLWFIVAARQWDEPLDLEALIESLAVASGMGRDYAERFRALVAGPSRCFWVH